MSKIKVQAVLRDGQALLYPRGPAGQFVGWIGCSPDEAEYTIPAAAGVAYKAGPKGMIYDAEQTTGDLFPKGTETHLKRLPYEEVESTPEIRRALRCGDLAAHEEPNPPTSPR